MEYEIKYLNSEQVGPEKVLEHVESMLYLRATEVMSDEVTWLIMCLKIKLNLTAMQVDNLNQPTLTQSEKIRKIFAIIGSLENSTPGTIKKALDVLVNLSENDNLSSCIHQFILTEFEGKVEIKPRFKWMDTIPTNPGYYIWRTISSRSRLDDGFLKEGTGDMLLFSGIERTELSSLLAGEIVEKSSTQTRHVRGQYIILETENHFHRICSRTSKNIHWIRREGGNFYWVRSRGDVQMLQNHIHPEQEELREEDFVEQLGATGTMPVCIADSPGMGKTVLLAKIAQMVQERFPEKRVFFFVLREIIPKLEEEKEKAAQWTEEDQLLSILTSCVQMKNKNNWDERALVKRALQTEMETYQFELFFDGFDEILSSQVATSKRLLQSLLKVPNCRIQVTTRLHMLEQLESTLGVLGYNILPFKLEEQRTFLRRYWITEHKVRDTNELLEFADKCLESIKSNVNDAGQDIAGIPLQCYMIAEVFWEDAKEYAEGETKTEKWILVESIFDLYQKLFDKHFRRAQEVLKLNGPQEIEFLKECYVLAAFQLLFPDFTDIIDMVSPATLKLTEEGINKVYSVGLMESIPGSDTPRFVHRTFAECVIAEYLVKGLPYRDSNSASDSRITSFLFQSIFHALLNRTFDIEFFRDLQLRIDGHRFQHLVINYFIDCHLHENLDAIQYDQLNEHIRFISSDVLIPCAVNHLLNTFEFILRTMRTFHIPQPNASDLCFISTAYCTNWKIVEKVVQFSGNILQITANIKRHNVSPLHSAVRRGTYSVSKYLLELYKNNLPPGVLHCCLAGSGRDNDSEINEKKDIIDLIVRANRSTLDKVWPSGTPILSDESSPILIQHLITLGAEVNTLDGLGRTVLHTVSYKNMTATLFSQFCELLHSRGFKYWAHAESTGEKWTPLHSVLRYVDVEKAALVCFKEGGADFKANSLHGESVVDHAVRYGRHYDCIKLLCEFGADVWGHYGGVNSCYTAAQCRNSDALVYLTERDDFTREINQFASHNGNTVLHTAAVIGFHEGVKILVENGADMYARNKEGDIPLISALKDQRNFNINVFREMEKKGFKTEEYIPKILHQLIMTRNDEEQVPGDIHELVMRCLEVTKCCSSSGTALAPTFEEPEVTIETLADYIHAFKRGHLATCFFGILQKVLDDILTGSSYPNLPPGVIEFIESSKKTRTLFVLTFDPEMCHNRISKFLANQNPTPGTSSHSNLVSIFKLSPSHKIDELKQTWASELQSRDSKVIIIGSEISEETRALLGNHETVMDSLEWNDLALTLQYKLLWHLLTPTHSNFQLCQISSVHFCKLLKNSQLSKLITSSYNQRVDLSAHLNEFVTHLVNEMDETSLVCLESISFRQLFPGTSNELKTEETTFLLAATVMNKLISYNVIVGETQMPIKLRECVAWYFVARKLLTMQKSKNEGEASSLLFTLDDFVSKIQNQKTDGDCDCATFLHGPYDLILFYFNWFASKKAFVTQIKSMCSFPGFFESMLEHRAQNIISLVSDQNILSQLGCNQIRFLLKNMFKADQLKDLTMAEENVIRHLAKVRNADLLQAFNSLKKIPKDLLKVLHPRRRMVLLECVLESGTDPAVHARNILQDFTIPVSQLIEFVKYLATKGLTQALYTKIGSKLTVVRLILCLTNEINTELFQTLRDAGFNFNVLNEDGQNLLHFVIVDRKNVEVIKALVECGSDYNKKDKYGRTLIHLLVLSSSLYGYRDYERVLHYLIGLGIDANAKSNLGETALDYLEQMGSFTRNAEKEGIRRILESAIADQQDAL